MHLGHGVKHALARAVALAVVPFNIEHLRALVEEKAVDAVVMSVVAAVVMYAAACVYDNVGVLADVEVIIYYVVDAAFGNNNGYMDCFALCIGTYINVDAGLIFFGNNIYVGCNVDLDRLTVSAERKSPGRETIKIGNCFQKSGIELI